MAVDFGRNNMLTIVKTRRDCHNPGFGGGGGVYQHFRNMLEYIIPDVHDKAVYTGYILYGLGVCGMCRSIYIGGKNRFEKLTTIDHNRMFASCPTSGLQCRCTCCHDASHIISMSTQIIPPFHAIYSFWLFHSSQFHLRALSPLVAPPRLRHTPCSARLAQVSSSPVWRSGVGVRRANGASAGDGWIRRIHTRPAAGRVLLGRAVGLG